MTKPVRPRVTDDRAHVKQQPPPPAVNMKPVSDRAYPFWPPGSPQHSDELLKVVQRFILAELPHNQIPYGNGAEIGLRQLIITKSQPLEGPGTNTNAEIGHYGSTLYDYFMAPYSAAGGNTP